MMLDERLSIVDQYFRRNPAKPQECAFHPLEPVCLAFSERGARMQAARVTQRSNEQVNPNTLAADPNLRIAKVDLHLMARCRLKADRRTLLRLQFPPPLLHPQLDRAKPDHDPMFAGQLLPDDIGIALVAEETFAKPAVQTIECSAPGRLFERCRSAFSKITADRIPGASEFLR
jgi:hypothetical protein